MRTRKTLAGVTAGALALGVLALSPVSPASALDLEVLAPGTTNNWLAGSMGFLPLDQGAVASDDLSAVITTTAKVGVFASDLDEDDDYLGDYIPPTWRDVTSTAPVVVGLPGPLPFLWVDSNPSRPATVTVELFFDENENGVFDENEEEDALDPVTMNFVSEDAVFAYTSTSPENTILQNNVLRFFSTPATLSGPLLQDWDPFIIADNLSGGDYWTFLGGIDYFFGDNDISNGVTNEVCDLSGPGAGDTCNEGIDNWSSGSWASLNGDDPVVADNYVTRLLELYGGGIWAGETGVINVTGWFDPTGDTPWNVSAAPLSPPTGFKVSGVSVQVIDQNVDYYNDSSITVSGAGGVEYRPGDGYIVPLTTKQVTFTVNARRDDPNDLNDEATLPIANTNIDVRLDAQLNNNETFKVNGAASDLGSGEVFTVRTDANGIATLVVDVARTPESIVSPFMYIDAYFEGYEGQAAGDFAYNYAEWHPSGVVNPYRSTFTLNGKSFTGDEDFLDGHEFYDSVLQNTNSTFEAQIIDTFGKPIPNIEVNIEDDDSSFETDVDTDGNGRATLNIPGQATGDRDLDVDLYDAMNDRHWVDGHIYYKPAAQMAAGKITPDIRQRAWVSEPDYNSWEYVEFKVTDSTGDPMTGVVGTVTTSRGVVTTDNDCPWGGDKTYEEYSSSALNVVESNGRFWVCVASKTVGTADVTLTIGGKSATTKVDFSNRWNNASTLTISARGGGEPPASVAPKSETKMRVVATDVNGNRLENAYVIVKIKGDARHHVGGRQRILWTGKNGVANFKVRAWSSGSFQVVAKTDGYSDTENLYETKFITAKTPTILIED